MLFVAAITTTDIEIESCKAANLSHTNFIEYPGTEEGLKQVVNDEHLPQVERFPVRHQPWSQALREVGVTSTQSYRW